MHARCRCALECGGELGDIERATAIAIPRLKCAPNVELLVIHGLRHTEDCPFDVFFFDAQVFAALCHPLKMLHVDLTLGVAMGHDPWAHEVDALRARQSTLENRWDARESATRSSRWGRASVRGQLVAAAPTSANSTVPSPFRSKREKAERSSSSDTPKPMAAAARQNSVNERIPSPSLSASPNAASSTAR